jgi:hypothetical protein
MVASGWNIFNQFIKMKVVNNGLAARARRRGKFLPAGLGRRGILCHNLGLLSRARVVKLVDAGDSKK